MRLLFTFSATYVDVPNVAGNFGRRFLTASNSFQNHIFPIHLAIPNVPIGYYVTYLSLVTSLITSDEKTIARLAITCHSSHHSSRQMKRPSRDWLSPVTFHITHHVNEMTTTWCTDELTNSFHFFRLLAAAEPP